MKNRMRFRPLFTAVLIVAFGELFAVGAARAQAVSKTAMAGDYSLTLKVLPAESFTGPKAEMVQDAGAAPVLLNGPEHPNHHMVVFIKKNGAPVENATVSVMYCKLPSKMGMGSSDMGMNSSHMGKWTKLPVARMHVAGKTLATTHYGNNVKLEPGSYEARVTVNGKNTATFRFELPG